MFLVAVALWIVSIILNVRLARAKARSVGGWVTLAVFFGLISTLILWVLATKKPMKPCPYCTHEIPYAAIRCPSCHADLVSSVSN